MWQEQQDRELSQLKEEIDRRLAQGRDFRDIKELLLLLSGHPLYQELKQQSGQFSRLDSFLNIWLQEKRRQLGTAEDIFYQVSSMGELETKYRKILYCVLRMENRVPEAYMGQAMEWLEESRISGVAIGEITVQETREKEDNLLRLAQELKRRGQVPNAIVLLQYANERYPGKETMLLEEADCWMRGQQWGKAYELLTRIEDPAEEVRDVMAGLRRVLNND